MDSLRGLCLDWRVVAALAAVALGIWVLAPHFVLPALSLLLLAACPLSMLLMLLLMRRGMSAGQDASQPRPGTADLPASVELTPEERIALLQARLAAVQAQQQAIAREIAHLQADVPPEDRAAEERGSGGR